MSYWRTGRLVGHERHVPPATNESRPSRADFVASTDLVKPADRGERTGAEISIRAGELALLGAPPMETQMGRFKPLDGQTGVGLAGEGELARRVPDDCQLESRWRQLCRANESPSADKHRLSIGRHSRQSRKQHKLEHSDEQYRSELRQTSDSSSSSNSRRRGDSRGEQIRSAPKNPSNNMSDQQRDATATPLSSSSLMGDPLVGLSGTNRATTTERRTTTTTTTKRVVKSSDDFMPSATDIQQVRSESRTGSISSTSPLFGASSLASSQQQQQQQSQTSTSTQSATSRNTSKAFTEGFSSPIVQETEEGRVLKLRFDLTQYEPDEILVKTVDNRLTVHAKHEEKSESKSVYREYNREFHLPEGTDVELIRSTLSKDGVLTVELPLPKTQLVGSSRRIPIDRI